LDYLSEADIVICRRLIEHTGISTMQDIRKALKASQNSQAFFETPCVEWILVNDLHFDVFYEHCSLFCEDSLKSAMQRLVLKLKKLAKSLSDSISGWKQFLSGAPTIRDLTLENTCSSSRVR
jgi:hypothetical protein